jgi:phosphoserine phosphatase RsbU/P
MTHEPAEWDVQETLIARLRREADLRDEELAALLLYTDGLTEARRDGSFFGIEGVRAVLGELQNPSPGEAIAVLRARVADFAYGTLTDDLCMLAARIH